MTKKPVIDHDWVRGVWKGGQPGGPSSGDELLSGPNVVQRGFANEIGPVGGLSSFDGFQVAKLGLSRYCVAVRCPEPLDPAGSFCELLSESGQEWDPPSLRL